MNTFSFNITLYPLYIPLILLLFVGNFTPGPNNIIASYSGFHFGFKKTIPHILGVTFGWPSLILAVNFGLVIIFIEFPIVQKAVEILGSLFLIYLAYTLIKVKTTQVNSKLCMAPPWVLLINHNISLALNNLSTIRWSV